MAVVVLLAGHHVPDVRLRAAHLPAVRVVLPQGTTSRRHERPRRSPPSGLGSHAGLRLDSAPMGHRHAQTGCRRGCGDRGRQRTVVPLHERIVVFRLGRLRAPLGPGVTLVLPCIDRWRRVDTRPRAFNVPPCRAMTRDGALVSVGADVRVRVHCPVLLLTAAQDVNRSSRSAAHTALASLLPRHSLHELQSESAKMADELALEVTKVTEPWGLEVERVELALEAVLCSPGATGLSAPLLPPCVPGLTPEAWGALAGPVQTILGGVMAMSDRQAAGRDAGCSLQAARSAVQEGGEGGDNGDDALLAAVGPLLCESLVERVGAVYRFDVQCRDGSCRTYHLDLKTGSGAVGRGPPPAAAQPPDAVLEMTEHDLVAVMSGQLRPLTAYMSGRLRISGDLGAATRLEEVAKAACHL
ncbi:stomatin-like protein 1 isoform X2 [Lethenteron reissneri]|uniref:stomatin-like protein 1 isoform X1 n=1 Tax=Lethenteron reissneri TaxID=7753 RepID=UPI002AB63C39|nr:stomatin-like protein 1 isoform X1 [Lethenteron reissneri]XP_061427398.1 stomatin-like protein 1 isoform X2 [Lethenteron reissneri]